MPQALEKVQHMERLWMQQLCKVLMNCRLPDNEISVRISMGIINNKNGDFGYKFTVFFAIPVYFSVKKDSEWESMCGKQFSL